MPVSQDLLHLIKQLSRAVTLRDVFAARQERLASSLYILPVFDMEACQVPLHSSGSAVVGLLSRLGIPRSDARGSADARGGKNMSEISSRCTPR